MSISIQMLSNNEYEVTVQSNTITTHIVSLSDKVHKATHRKHKFDVAIREIKLNHSDFYTVDYELTTLKHLDHPNLVKIIDYFSNGRTFRIYISYDWVI